MTISDLKNIPGRRYPAKRRTQNLVGGAAPVQAEAFSMGYVTLDPNGGQVPWHNQEQEEAYFVLDGVGEMCLGEEIREIRGGQAVYIPSGVYHQITNIRSKPLKFVYCYGPAGDVDHWKQELTGTLPKEGIDVPALPPGAARQCTDAPDGGES
ncbi:MAG: cupin domain-containing protein [Spirochaetaceae bacterium]|nr:cupin domain-containing protein [Spirochaetaceae bacterium]MDT8297040.1 cupin domain-containing protein [Spirochaetaceae bacterium]